MKATQRSKQLMIKRLVSKSSEPRLSTNRKLPAVQQEFIRFALDVEVNKEMYISLLNSEQQLEISKASTVGNVAIIDAAITPLFPTKPKKTQIVVIGLVIGLLLGFALTQLLAAINKVVRDPKKLKLETGVPTLSIFALGRRAKRSISIG